LANLEQKRGGLGYGLYGDDPLAFFLLDEQLAYGNPSWIALENCFVPEENLLGRPGQFLGENWLGKINFAFTANYLGSARAMDDWGLNYVRERGGGKDPYRQLRFGELKSLLRRFATFPLWRGANVQTGS